jgi:hypothetical protein
VGVVQDPLLPNIEFLLTKNWQLTTFALNPVSGRNRVFSSSFEAIARSSL